MPRIGVHDFIIPLLQPNRFLLLLLTGLLLLLCSSKGGTQYKRGSKKGEEVRPYDMPGPAEEMEKNQKILLWLMEGQKEIVQHKRSPYGSVMAVDSPPLCYIPGVVLINSVFYTHKNTHDSHCPNFTF